MPLRLNQLWPAARLCADGLVTFICWILWLGLVLLFLAQIVTALSRELAVPGFVLRSLEERLQASGVHARVGRATFDPTGGIVLENLRLSLPAYAEPVADLRAVYIQLNPWLLAAGQFEARRIHATGVTFSVPAMLAPSGRSEQLLDDLDVVLEPTDRELRIQHLATHVAGIPVTASGSLHLTRERELDRVEPLPFVAALAEHYPDFSRQLIRAAEHVTPLEGAAVHISLAPSTTRGAIATVHLFAEGVSLPQYRGLHVSHLLATARVPLLGVASALVTATAEADAVRTDDGLTVQHVSARTSGFLRREPLAFDPREIQLTARDFAVRQFFFDSLAAHVDPTASPRLHATLLTSYAGLPAAVQATADLTRRTASVRFDGALSPLLLDSAATLLRRDLRAFIDLAAPIEISASADFAPDWKFHNATARVATRQLDARGVTFDSIAGELSFDGRHVVATHAIARLGENVARGRFEQDLATREFRFLLDGRLRPLVIAPWFREWWSNFFQTLEFPRRPPRASVDVAGRWLAGHETSVFLFAEATDSVIRGAPFDYARTRLFIRPNFIDGLELFGTHGIGEIRGTFTRHYDLAQRAWREFTLSFESSLPFSHGAHLLGPQLAPILDPYVFENNPRLKFVGHFEGPASPLGPGQRMTIHGDSTGDFSFHQFPARNLSFEATVRDREVTLDRFEAEVASGTLSGRARLWDEASTRRLGFDASLRGASLGRTVATVAEYTALRRGAPPPAPDRFVSSRNNVRLDLSLSAEGTLDDLYSYRGSGNAALEGAELGELRLLGGLSALLDFTALRFNSARTDFRVEGPTLVFPSVNITGEKSAIQAHGDYSLQRRQLNFNARVYPFHEGGSLLQNVVGAVLTPISSILEVKLTGPLDQPSWAFVMGPTNLIRSLNASESASPAAPPPASSSPPASPAPSPTDTSTEEKTH
jgi:hypothetical protein